MTPDERAVLRGVLFREVRIGAVAALVVVGLLFAITYGLRALGVGNSSRARATTMQADVDSIKGELRALSRRMP